MEYRQLIKEEINRIAEIDRSEVIDYIYYLRNGKLALVKEYWNLQRWNEEQIQKHSDSLLRIFNRGGYLLGAFDNSKVAGIIVLDNEFIGRHSDQLNLAGLWISKQYRRKGVGKTLVELVKNKAREMGAKKLYVSATPSQNTVIFYLNRGFKLAEEINEYLFELEPEDIHMELSLIR
ncbi:MAG: GNAT family N-acetyltransferase [Candidatus Hodarchaeales archaeon]